MQSLNKQSQYSLRADGNALGGYLKGPVEKTLPALAPVSLPPVGGFAVARSGAFTAEEIVSCSSAYSHVSGQAHPDGSGSILITTVVEGLDILEVVTAERVVVQLALSLPNKPGQCIGISTAGTAFEGLRLGGLPCRPRLNPDLLPLVRASGLVTCDDARLVGDTQVADVLSSHADRQQGYAYQWALRRQQMAAASQSTARKLARCSLIDSLELPGGRAGCVVEIPEFGVITLAELLISPDSVQLIGVRADLGCPVTGRITSNAVGGGGEYV
jgi:hypothetical protein